MMVNHTGVMSIPTIDLSGLGTQPDDARIGHELINAYEIFGFSYVVNHGIPESLISSVFEQSRIFHAQSLEMKMDCELDANHRGYMPLKTETDLTTTLEDITKPNLSESFMMMREFAADDPAVTTGTYLAGPNRWPKELPAFRKTLTAYNETMCQLATNLIRVIAEGLGDKDAMLPSFNSPTTWLRLLHYPPQDQQAPADEYGSAPHCDFGAITLLAQDDVGGLSVKTTTGEWVDVPPVPGAFVMNVGDMLHRWSNGRLLSTPHRVTNRSGRERYSIPFFFDPDVKTVISPLPSCTRPDNPAAFPPIVFEDFLRNELESAYPQHRPKA